MATQQILDIQGYYNLSGIPGSIHYAEDAAATPPNIGQVTGNGPEGHYNLYVTGKTVEGQKLTLTLTGAGGMSGRGWFLPPVDGATQPALACGGTVELLGKAGDPTSFTATVHLTETGSNRVLESAVHECSHGRFPAIDATPKTH